MSNRDSDVLVLQRVFGVKQIHYSEYDTGKEWPQFIPSGKPWRTHSIDAKPVPHFMTDPTAGYSVLVRVREVWDAASQWYFNDAIHRLWHDRWPDEVDYWHYFRYEPGDYARAALQALGVSVEEGEARGG